MVKILSCHVENFASYKSLDFDFSDQGLCLVSGPTGAGKSTLCDIIPWVLFGRTSKGGAVDEVRAWGANSTTFGTILVSHGSRRYEVFRSRLPNDLFFKVVQLPETARGEVIRGKDLADTQRLINQHLGLDLETYLAGAYYHEFSQTAGFFTATAKSRREIIEQLVDLSMATDLTDKLTEYKKELKAEVQTAAQGISVERGKIDLLIKKKKTLIQSAIDWDEKHFRALEELRHDLVNYEADVKAKKIAFEQEKSAAIRELELDLKELTKNLESAEALQHKVQQLTFNLANRKAESCPTCGGPQNHQASLVLTKDLYEAENQLKALTKAEATANQLRARLKSVKARTFQTHGKRPEESQLERLEAAKNPYSVDEAEQEIQEVRAGLVSLEDQVVALNSELADVETLLDVTADFRTHLITGAVANLESYTNDLLTRFFDAEIRVVFKADKVDKIDVEVYKDGNLATFTQLSKGQRQLLKLCFSVAVMKAVGNFNSTSFDCLFFDEVLTGLDEEMKLKAYPLFQELALSASSVFVVEHSVSFKSCFDKTFEVTLLSDNSVIEER